MKKKLDPVITGVIIVVSVVLTLFLYGIFATNRITSSGPRYDEREDNGVHISEETNDINKENNNEVLEKEENINDNNIPDNSTNKEFVMTCSKNTERGYEENIFTFNYNLTYNDNYITKYVIKLNVPAEFDANDYYVNEQIMNGGRYRMSLEGRTIISEIDPTWTFWNSSDFRYKDMAYRYINKQFVEDGYDCKF